MNKKAKAGLIGAFILVGILFVAVAFAAPANKGSRKNSCSDTDGGIVPNTVGTTSGYYNRLPYSNTDYCISAGTVKEYYCSGTAELNVQQACTYGCTNGACNPAPADSCADTDGGLVPAVNGTTYGYLGGSFYSYTDACSSSTVLVENYCGGSGGNYRGQTAYSCGNSTNATTCIIGACV